MSRVVTRLLAITVGMVLLGSSTLVYPQGAQAWIDSGSPHRGYTIQSEPEPEPEPAPPMTAALGPITFTDGATVPYSFEDQVIEATVALSVDSRASDAAWSVSIQASDFVWSPSGLSSAVSGNDIVASDLFFTIAEDALETVIEDASKDAPYLSAGAAAMGTPYNIMDSSGESIRGSYRVPISMTLFIPALARAGLYTSTLLTTMAVAP